MGKLLTKRKGKANLNCILAKLMDSRHTERYLTSALCYAYTHMTFKWF